MSGRYPTHGYVLELFQIEVPSHHTVCLRAAGSGGGLRLEAVIPIFSASELTAEPWWDGGKTVVQELFPPGLQTAYHY